jgi:serine/threonine-protein kinase
MTLAPGQMLSHYRLVEKIGEGGMGVVWKATDTKLDREVAIKVLPEDFAQDAERLARFEREAKLLASLNHANIAAIYGLEQSDGVRFLTMELVPGRTLAEMIGTGSLPVDEALDLCRQIAEGLEAAHDSGVIHRDLKPGNVKVTPDGKVKVLDFGLAKGPVGTAADSDPDLSQSPTVTTPLSRDGMILGTAPYMSPEQARGKPVDKRTDIWSLGCLLYECLTGRQAFRGETVTDVLSAILRAEPDGTALPERTPPRVRDLLERCLEKNPRNRLHDMGDARIELERSFAGREWTTSGIRVAAIPASAPRISWRAAMLMAGGILLGAFAASILGTYFSSGSSVAPIMRFSFEAPPGRKVSLDWVDAPLLSPDGQTIAYRAHEKAENNSEWVLRLYTRRLNEYGQVPVESSEGILGPPAFSHDGRWLAFATPVTRGSTSRHLVKVPVDRSAPPLPIADWPANMEAPLAWLPDGDIMGVTISPYSLIRFPADGSAPAAPIPVHGIEPDCCLSLRSVLPDGRNVLAFAWFLGGRGGQLNLVSVDTQTGEARLLIEDASHAVWSPTGHLLFTRRDNLLAIPFDPERLETTGGPLTITDGIFTASSYSNGAFDLSASGTLAHYPGRIADTTRRLVLVDRNGQVNPWSEDRRSFDLSPAVSPDGRRFAVVIIDPEDRNWEIWASEIARPRLRPIVSMPGFDCSEPVWSGDGEWLAYECDGQGTEGGVYRRRFDPAGEPELLLERESLGIYVEPTSFSPGGSVILITSNLRGGSVSSLLLPVEPGLDGTRALKVLVPNQTTAPSARFSPDGRWIAYASDETGRAEIYLQSYNRDGQTGPRTMISNDGGVQPLWSKANTGSRRELFYWDRGSRLMAVSIATDPELTVSEPRQVFDSQELGIVGVDTMPDGRFLAILRSEEERPSRINVVLNFLEEIRQRTSSTK